jgi:hypothetical protein
LKFQIILDRMKVVCQDLKFQIILDRMKVVCQFEKLHQFILSGRCYKTIVIQS